MQLKHPDTILLIGLGGLFLVAATGFWLWLGAAGWVPSLTLLLVLVAGLQLHLHRVREHQDVHQLRQIQALTAIHQLIPFQAVSPWMTGWAATPEFAATLYEIVRERKPQTVVELGSGASTVIVAAALEQNGSGCLISIDQDAEFAMQTRRTLERHNLSGKAQVVHAPLTETQINGVSWLWYDIGSIPQDDPIDVLIIDGPNQKLQKMARYPAIPLLIDSLSVDAVVVLDDAERKDERRTVARWTSEYQEFKARFLDSRKGTAILSRTAGVRSSVPASISVTE